MMRGCEDAMIWGYVDAEIRRKLRLNTIYLHDQTSGCFPNIQIFK